MSETLLIEFSSSDCQEKKDQQDSNIETECSLINELADSYNLRPHNPKDFKFLFIEPSDETRNAFSIIFETIKLLTVNLEDSRDHVNIRDDCSYKPAAVILRLPPRKNTS